MANNLKNNKTTGNAAAKKGKKKTSSPAVIKSPYLDEKDRKAIKFLKKHPVPEEFLK